MAENATEAPAAPPAVLAGETDATASSKPNPPVEAAAEPAASRQTQQLSAGEAAASTTGKDENLPEPPARPIPAFAPAIPAGKPQNLVSLVTKSPLKTIVGELGRENDQHIEVYDLKTSQSQTFAKADLRTINKDIGEQSVIDAVGLANYMAWRIKQVLPLAATGKIAQIDGPVIFLTLGKSIGLEAGKELTVYRGGTEIKDPDTGKLLGKQRRKVARLQAIEVQDNLTKARLLGDLETRLEIGDEVEPAVVNNLVGVLPLVNDDDEETASGKRVAEELTTGLVNREVPVVERRLLDKVLVELNRQQSPAFDSSKAQQIGKQLGAYAIVVGTLSAKGNTLEAQLRLVRVETGEIMLAASQIIRDARTVAGNAEPRKAVRWQAALRSPRLALAMVWRVRSLCLGRSHDRTRRKPDSRPKLGGQRRRDDSRSARAGRKMILELFRSEHAKFVDNLIKLARDNRDVVAGISILSPYDKSGGLTPAD